MGYLDDSVAQLAVFEGVVPWMYLDTRGFVTVDMGVMLPTAAAAAALGFVMPLSLGSRVATDDETRRDWARVKGMTPGRLPGHYMIASCPRLPEANGALARVARVTAMDAELREHLPGYGDAPDAAKLALLDMRYNLGLHGLIDGFPHLCSDVGAGRFDLAALACSRNGIGDARNVWTRQKFEEAAKAA